MAPEAKDRAERALLELRCVASLLCSIYRTGQNLHVVDTEGLSTLLDRIAEDIKPAIQ